LLEFAQMTDVFTAHLLLPFTFLAAENLTAEALVQDAKTRGKEVADVGQIEKGQRNAYDSVHDCH
jgi:hypothetical protein